MEKYELIKSEEKGLCRIRALKRIVNKNYIVEKGALGGLVFSENNLSQEGNCWIAEGARALELSRVLNEAYLAREAIVSGHATVRDSAVIRGKARINGYACVNHQAIIEGDAMLTDSVEIYQSAIVGGKTFLSGNAVVSGSANVLGGNFGSNIALRYGIALDDSLETLVRCSVGLPIINKKIIAYKYVQQRAGEDFYRSLHDYGFVYRMNEHAICAAPEISKASCASGLHCASLSYWESVIKSYHKADSEFNKVCLAVEVELKDIITIQEGKIRCKRLKVVGVVENSL